MPDPVPYMLVENLESSTGTISLYPFCEFMSPLTNLFSHQPLLMNVFQTHNQLPSFGVFHWWDYTGVMDLHIYWKTVWTGKSQWYSAECCWGPCIQREALYLNHLLTTLAHMLKQLFRWLVTLFNHSIAPWGKRKCSHLLYLPEVADLFRQIEVKLRCAVPLPGLDQCLGC